MLVSSQTAVKDGHCFEIAVRMDNLSCGDWGEIQNSKGLNNCTEPWTNILLVVNVGSLEKRSNQPKYKEPRTRSPKTTAKLI